MSGVRLVDRADLHRPSGRPLLVVDVDEVILHFIAPLAAFLEAHGFHLVPRSFALTGNVTRRGGGQAIPAELVKELIAAFFEREVDHQPAVAGAVATLTGLADRADVVALTNVPAAQAERRAAHLSRLGLSLAMIANAGSKGPALATLAAAARAGDPDLPVIFVDDGPNHLAAARKAVNAVRLVHFVADPAWFAMAPEVGGTWLRTGDWGEVARAVTGVIDAAPIVAGPRPA